MLEQPLEYYNITEVSHNNLVDEHMIQGLLYLIVQCLVCFLAISVTYSIFISRSHIVKICLYMNKLWPRIIYLFRQIFQIYKCRIFITWQDGFNSINTTCTH